MTKSVTISDGDSQIVIDGSTDFGVSEPRNIGEFTGTNGQSLAVRLTNKEDFLQAIRNAQADIMRARSEEQAAKEMLKEEIEQLDAWIDHESAKEEVKRTRDELNAQVIVP